MKPYLIYIRPLILLFAIGIFYLPSTAQERKKDKILLNNAKVVEGYVVNIGAYEVRYRNERLQKKADKAEWDKHIDAETKRLEAEFEEAVKGLNPDMFKDDKDRVDDLRYVKAKKIEDLIEKYSKRKYVQDVFSVTYGETGQEEVVYSPDTLGLLVIDTLEPDLEYTVAEMRRYLQGRTDGKNHKAPWATVGGGAIGIVGSFAGFYGPLVPTVYLVIVSATQPRIREEYVSNPHLIGDEAYEDGYVKSARRKKIKNIVISSVSSLVISAAALNIILN